LGLRKGEGKKGKMKGERRRKRGEQGKGGELCPI